MIDVFTSEPFSASEAKTPSFLGLVRLLPNAAIFRHREQWISVALAIVDFSISY